MILAAGAGNADETAPIEWDPARRLQWSDFTGSVPAGTDSARVAATAGSLAWSYQYTVTWARDGCSFSIDAIESRALFHRDESWARPDNRTDDVLRHEQVHFDILELYKRRFDAEARRFRGPGKPCAGRSERRASRDAQAEIERLLGPVYDATWSEYRARQESYDRETRHGTNAEAQADWVARIEAELSATPGP